MEHQIGIPTEHNELRATIHYPAKRFSCGADESCRWPLVIICHGFVSNRIGVDRLFVKTARELSESGNLVVRFDYGGCGESTGDYGTGGGLDQLIQETKRVLDYMLAMDCVDWSNVTLLGHSLGGAVALLTAAEDQRVKNLVLWSPVAHPHLDIVRIVGKRVYEEAQKEGEADYRGYRLSHAFFDNLRNHHPLQQIKRFRGDVLLVHGTADEEIPPDYCSLYQRVFWLRSDGLCDKELIPAANHTYSSDIGSREAISKTKVWLLELERRKKNWNDWTI